jgi:ligand-binding SRPBCC domain-containing protein
MATYELRTETTLQAPLGSVFDFFSRAENLERLTPASLRFQILTPLPIEMRVGATIEYRLRLFGVPFRWVSEITVWEPGGRFVDVQRRGPYRKWVHEHRFEAEGDATRMWDVVQYEVPGGFLAPLVHALFVRRQVEAIFRYRSRAVADAFDIA